ncbi:unnamed protein product [Caenorhabditis brenneri]
MQLVLIRPPSKNELSHSLSIANCITMSQQLVVARRYSSFVLQKTHFLLDAFAMLSVILYCPIFISIRTKHHLISALQSKPDRYIRYQATFIGLSKILNFAFMINHIIEVVKISTEPKIELGFLVLSNFGATPFIIQATYLSCNKRNVQAMLSMICPGRCLCRNPRRNNLVAPVMLMDGETTVHAMPDN